LFTKIDFFIFFVYRKNKPEGSGNFRPVLTRTTRIGPWLKLTACIARSHKHVCKQRRSVTPRLPRQGRWRRCRCHRRAGGVCDDAG
jgi:hypothetical protein